jgi:hypothetical protein
MGAQFVNLGHREERTPPCVGEMRADRARSSLVEHLERLERAWVVELERP